MALSTNVLQLLINRLGDRECPITENRSQQTGIGGVQFFLYLLGSHASSRVRFHDEHHAVAKTGQQCSLATNCGGRPVEDRVVERVAQFGKPFAQPWTRQAILVLANKDTSGNEPQFVGDLARRISDWRRLLSRNQTVAIFLDDLFQSGAVEICLYQASSSPYLRGQRQTHLHADRADIRFRIHWAQNNLVRRFWPSRKKYLSH